MPLTELRRLARAVDRVYARLETESHFFIDKSGLCCPSGCGHCCTGKDITASVLEFLPFALSLYDSGQLEEQYSVFKEKQNSLCLFYRSDDTVSNHCEYYHQRGLVCRLFGNSAMLDKAENRKFLGCSVLKNLKSTDPAFGETVNRFAPLASDYYMQIRSVDLRYGSMYMPINMAILKSMEMVYFSTRRKQKRAG